MGAERQRRRVLLGAAREIADGAPVDWRRVSEGRSDLGDSIERLRLIEAIAKVHRTPLPEQPPTAEAISDLRTVDPSAPDGPAPGSSSSRTGPLPPRGKSATGGTWGRLQIGEFLGKGSFGEVYRAHDPVLKKDVALKLIRIERGRDGLATERFLQEARRLARVVHENVLVVHGADEHEGRVALWTDLVEGRTLEEQLKSHGNLSACEAAVVGRHLCRALAAVHRAGLVHRDVKTNNIMRRRKDGQIILMDFSAAARRRPWSDQLSDDPVAGTPLFIAPEVLRGGEGGVAADIYSLGIVLYRLVTGAFPVEASSLEELYEKHRKRESIPLLDRRPDLPDPFIKVIEKSLDPAPASRYTSMGEMERDLARLLVGPTPDPRPRSLWRRPAGWVAAVVLLLAVASLGLLDQVSSPAPLRVGVDLLRISAGAEERLLAGAAVYSGDLLFLEIEGSLPMHVYALNVDPTGEPVALFPAPDLTLGNPLEAGMSHRLPGVVGGKPNYWKVGGVKGLESFFVFASGDPLPDAARLIERASKPGSDGAEVADSAPRTEGTATGGAGSPAAHLRRGVTGRESPGASARAPNDQESARLLESLLRRAGSDARLRAWQISIENHG